MHHLNPFFALVIFLIAYITAYLINLKYKLHSVNNRYETIDGLRGFLALSVFSTMPASGGTTVSVMFGGHRNQICTTISGKPVLPSFS